MCGRIEDQRFAYGVHMATSFSASQLDRFRREAKPLGRSLGIIHSHALDRIAIAHGFANWSLLEKHSIKPDSTLSPYRFMRTLEEMRLASYKLQLPAYSRANRIDVARESVKDLSRRFVSAQNAADFAVDYMQCLLSLPRFKVYAATTLNWEMRCWLPYLTQRLEGDATILVNRRYKPVGQVSDDHVEYQEFPHLQLRLNAPKMQAFAFHPSRPGSLYNDGCLPWASRKNAEAYQQRLLELQATLRG
jgi:hypothetical protein